MVQILWVVAKLYTTLQSCQAVMNLYLMIVNYCVAYVKANLFSLVFFSFFAAQPQIGRRCSSQFSNFSSLNKAKAGFLPRISVETVFKLCYQNRPVEAWRPEKRPTEIPVLHGGNRRWTCPAILGTSHRHCDPKIDNPIWKFNAFSWRQY